MKNNRPQMQQAHKDMKYNKNFMFLQIYNIIHVQMYNVDYSSINISNEQKAKTPKITIY